MEFFENWTLNESEMFSLANLPTYTGPPYHGPRPWAPSHQIATTGNRFATGIDRRDSSNTSPNSSEASDTESPWGEKVIFTTYSEDGDLEPENQGPSMVIEKEPAHHRIQRRRIQNRNAQRNFRQRQENERRKLEEQLTTAEQQCKKLSRTCNELSSNLNTMRDRVGRLETENTVLRTSFYSMPWRSESS